MRFVKVKTSLRRNMRKLSVSAKAGLAFYDSLTLAEDLAAEGARVGYLEHRDLGPLTTRQLATELNLRAADLRRVTEELTEVKLWVRDGDLIHIPRFEENTTPTDPRSAERVRRFREKQKATAMPELPLQETDGNAVTDRYSNGDVTPLVTPLVTHRQKTEDRRLETSVVANAPTGDGGRKPREPWRPSPPPATLPTAFPTDVERLKAMAITFLDAFANARSDEAVKKHVGPYVEALAMFRSRGATVTDTWRAFCDARLARDGQPVFGAGARKALSFIAARPPGSRRDAVQDDAPQSVRREDEA